MGHLRKIRLNQQSDSPSSLNICTPFPEILDQGASPLRVVFDVVLCVFSPLGICVLYHLLVVPWVCQCSVIVTFAGHTHIKPKYSYMLSKRLVVRKSKRAVVKVHARTPFKLNGVSHYH